MTFYGVTAKICFRTIHEIHKFIIASVEESEM